MPPRADQIEGEVTGDYRRVKLSRLHPGEQFAYVFDLGDDWAHLCTVGARRIDPVKVLGGTTVHLWGHDNEWHWSGITPAGMDSGHIGWADHRTDARIAA